MIACCGTRWDVCLCLIVWFSMFDLLGLVDFLFVLVDFVFTLLRVVDVGLVI